MMVTVTALIDIQGGGESAEVEIPVEIEVSYTSTPGEKRTWEHPGCPPEIDIYDATLEHDVTALGGMVTLYKKGEGYELSECEIDSIKESIQNGDDFCP